MTPRHVVLAVAAFAVFGACVYLFLQVRKPASAQASGDDRPAVAQREDRAPAVETGDQDPVKPVAAPPAISRSGGSSKAAPPSEPSDPEAKEDKLNVKLDAVMAEANKAYDRMDFDEARTIAQRVLAKEPANARMLRIMVSAACIENDGPEAQKHYNKLQAPDRAAMKTRCAKYGITFTDPPK